MKKLFALMLCLALMLSIAACGGTAKPAENNENNTEEAAAVEVSTISELLEAIAPGANIKLAGGTYNLTKAKGYGGKNVSEYYRWDNMGDNSQYALVIEGVEDLTISSSDGAEIVAESYWANVLRFDHCDNLTLKGIHVGHTVQTESCEGGVISLSASDNVVIDGCDLYGCGTIGVDAYQCWNLKITETSIHHCSSGAVSIGSGKHIKISGCSVSDCGNGEYSAWSCFNIGDASDVKITDCSVKDSRFTNLISGYFEKDSAVVENLSVTGNSFDILFGFYSQLDIKGFTLTDNIINKWHDTWDTPEIIIDGKTYSDADLDEAYGSQLSANGVGKVEVEQAAITTDGTKTVHVSTADEFIKAIASDTLIIIDADEIDLSTAKNYGESAVEFWDEPDYDCFGEKNWVWQQVYDGFALWVGDVSNLHIEGGKLVTEPRYANVLAFYTCSNISINGTTLGHNEGSECAGGVVYLYNCSDVILESCDLYGCGIYGVETNRSCNVRLQNNYIHDCSYGAAWFYKSSDVTCLNTAIINCPSPAISVVGCENFVWDDTIMAQDCTFDPAFG